MSCLAAVTLVPWLTGCQLLDRERYSLIVRKPAHQYRRLTPLEREELDRYESTRVSRADGFHASVAYDPFRPFAYCRLHDSHHVTASLTAIVAAPVEYPSALGGDLGGVLVRGVPDLLSGFGRLAARGAGWVWHQVFPPRAVPPESEPRAGENAPPR